MTIANDIKIKLNYFRPGEVFTIQDFGIASQSQPSLVRYLNRRVAKNELVRLSKGKYYKPRNTRFGQLPPAIEEVVKDLLVRNNKIIGYISGIPAFANLGLTTQISSAILIGSTVYRRPTERSNYKISFFLQRNPINESTIPFLQLLDAVRFFKEIPATTPDEVIIKITAIFRQHSPADIKTLVDLGMSYPNYVRALLGAILDNLGQSNNEKLKNSLNGVTTYKLNISPSVFPTKNNWNII